MRDGPQKKAGRGLILAVIPRSGATGNLVPVPRGTQIPRFARDDNEAGGLVSTRAPETAKVRA